MVFSPKRNQKRMFEVKKKSTEISMILIARIDFRRKPPGHPTNWCRAPSYIYKHRSTKFQDFHVS